jgi:hypothetical protein
MKTQKKDLTTVAYEKGVQDYLKEVAESGSDVHENYTPAEICDMMLDKVDLTKAETVLVLYNIELLFALKKRKFSGHVTFFTQSEEKAGIAPKIFQNLTVEYIDKEANPLYHMENKWPDKFDIVIANPPYSKKLDLKFLDKAFNVAKKEIVFVHPSSYIIEKKGVTKIYKEIRELIESHLSSITMFNGNGIFGIGLFVPCVITHLNLNNQEKNFKYENLQTGQSLDIKKDELDKISIFGFRQEFTSFSNKIKKFLIDKPKLQDFSNLDKKENRLTKDCYFVEFTPISGRGHRGDHLKTGDQIMKDDFFTFISKHQLEVKSGNQGDNTKYKIWFEFETKKEGENFLKFLTTRFAMGCLSLTKTSQNLNNKEFNTVPWMDFTQEWSDVKLYAHFNITKEEQAFIKEVIPPYYD